MGIKGSCLGQQDAEFRAGVDLAANFDLASMLGDDAAYHRQAEAVALPRLLGVLNGV